MSKVALVQTTSTDDFDGNVEVAERLLREAVETGAGLIAFPEVFLYLGGRSKKLALAEPLEGRTVSRFREHAARHGVMVLLGSVHERIPTDENRVYNTSVLIDGSGGIASVYRKLKLFDVDLPHLRIKESDTIAPGTELPPVVDTPVGRVGLTICFDLRFPELYRHLRENGAEIVTVPSNFTQPTGAAHWDVLLRARAVENQVFVLAPAQEGQHNSKYRSFGHSLVVDPWGRRLACRETGPGVVTAELDLGYLVQVRRELPLGGELPVP